MWPFSDFQCGFRSSRSTADLLPVVSDTVARALNRSGATQAVALDKSKAFDRVWQAGLLYKLRSYGISDQGFLKGPFLVLCFSYYKLMTFLMMLSVILLSMLMILLSILNVIRHLICGNN